MKRIFKSALFLVATVTLAVTLADALAAPGVNGNQYFTSKVRIASSSQRPAQGR